MKVILSAVLLLSISQVRARSKLEEVMRNYETKYGLIFDVSSVLSRLYAYGIENKETAQQVDLAKHILQFGIDINSHSRGHALEKAHVSSPLSVASILGELFLGADGKTYNEIAGIFGIADSRSYLQNPEKIHQEFGRMLFDLNRGSFHSKTIRRRNTMATLNDEKLVIANGIFVQRGINLRHDYQSTVERIYQSEISHLDFHRAHGKQARDYINEWVEKKTHGKIRQIISEEIPQDMKMIIVNALHFRSMWENPFIKGATTRGKFYPDGMDAKPIFNVPMMTVAGTFPYYESKNHGCRIIGLPYKGGDTVLYIILPNGSNRKSLYDFQTRLTADAIEELIRRAERKSILVSFPKMHLKSSVNLKETLRAMGLISLFDPKECNLSLMVASATDVVPRLDTDKGALNRYARGGVLGKMRAPVKNDDDSKEHEQFDKGNVFVADILHKVDLNISEDGTEGAATSATVMGRSDVEEDFEVNRPFLFLIRHFKTKLPIFYGSVVDPRI